MNDSTLDTALDFGQVADAHQLLDDLSQVNDFPAISQVISQVNHIATAENSRTNELTESILKDVSLTNKLLRIVNSVHYGQFGSAAINTVSRAIVILGYDAVRDAALSLMLYEHMQNHAQAADLKAEAVESFYCGVLGRALAARTGIRDTEEVLICALFRNLGRMMCRLHFYAKAQEVEKLILEQTLDEEVASRRVFGLSYDEFGQALGRYWHLPASLLQGMAPLPPGPVKLAGGGEAIRQQVLANLARELYLASRDADPEHLREALADLGRKYGEAVRLQTEEMEELVYQASAVMEKEARLLEMDLRASPLLTRLTQRRGGDAPPAAAEEKPEEAAAQVSPASEAEARDPGAVLISGMQDLTSMMLENASPVDVLHVASELLYRAHCFDNVLICAIAPGGKELVGRIGLGRDAERIKGNMRIPVAFAPDVFHAALSKNADILIADTRADSIRGRIPAWYAERIGARSFLLLPIVINNRPIALVYGDRRDGPLALPAQTLGLIKALRNQVALALRQKYSS
jgi:HD-like signal output (HDOD) protein